MAERINLGKVLVTLEGEWDGTRAYDKYCEVTNDGSSYVSKKSVPIGTLITDTTYWQKRASKGADGQDGTDGNDGVDAYQPFKGWYSDTTELNTSFGSPVVGDYAYVKGASASDPVTIYQCTTAGTWVSSGRTFNPSNNQEFASGEALNVTHIVDNLNSSSATDVLSAKQGKVLDEKIGQLGPKLEQITGSEAVNIDLSQFELHPGVIDYNASTWAMVTNNKYKHIVIPVEGGKKYTITYNSNNYPVWGYFKSYTEPTANEQTPDWCTGYGAAIRENKTVSNITTPTDCKYLYVRALGNNSDVLPASIVKDATEGTLGEMEDAISGNASAIADNAGDISSLKSRTSALESKIGSSESTEETIDDFSDSSVGYVNATSLKLVSTTDDSSHHLRTTDPMLLNEGDVVEIAAGGMSSSRAVVSRVLSSTPLEDGDGVAEVLLVGDARAYNGTPYSYTIQRSGYYVMTTNVIYLTAYVKIYHGSVDNIQLLQQAVEANAEDIADNLERIEALEESSEDIITPMINVFGDILPSSFKSKLFEADKDIEIVCVGDSLTGLVQYCDENNNYKTLPAGFRYNHWTYQLWDRLCLNKPVCWAIDAEGITTTGTWADYTNVASGDYGDYSVTSNTNYSESITAAISFTFDADTYDKCNIVMSVMPDGAETEIIIAEGDNKMLASLDRVTWVEANGFEFAQIASVAAMRERHRRIWLKKVSGVTGDITITYHRTDSDTTKYMYFWGVEMWRGVSLFLTNLGRGGRNMSKLNKNISDILDRKPDLCIFEPPLANETSYFSTFPTSTLKTNYSTWLTAYANGTSNFADIDLMVVLPHGRAQYYDGNNLAYFVSDGTADIYNHQKAKLIFQYIKTQTSSYKEHIAFVDLMEQCINEGFARGMTIEDWMTGNHDGSTMTYDDIHLHTNGSKIWTKYLAPLFQ